MSCTQIYASFTYLSVCDHCDIKVCRVDSEEMTFTCKAVCVALTICMKIFAYTSFINKVWLLIFFIRLWENRYFLLPETEQVFMRLSTPFCHYIPTIRTIRSNSPVVYTQLTALTKLSLQELGTIVTKHSLIIHSHLQNVLGANPGRLNHS